MLRDRHPGSDYGNLPYMGDFLKGAIVLAAAALVITVLVLGPERVWCQVRGKL